MFQKLSCLPYVFGSVLACAKSAHLFQKLYYSFSGLCLSLSSLVTLSQTERLFYVSLRSQVPQQQYTVLSFSSNHAKAWPQSQTDLFTCTTVLHCGNTFLRRIDLLHSIACTTVLHCGHPQVYKLTLLTFELSSFRENGFLFLLHFLRCSR